MIPLKILIILAFFLLPFAASCYRSGPAAYVIAESKDYEASLYRQHCAVCHGPEGEGKTLDDGKIVPSLRKGEFKFKSEAEIRDHIARGGNGMTPFQNQLTDREVRRMAAFVREELRGVK